MAEMGLAFLIRLYVSAYCTDLQVTKLSDRVASFLLLVNQCIFDLCYRITIVVDFIP